jgi:hypothetical protein
VDLPHPRDMNSPQFIELQKELTQMVMEEQMRYENAEITFATSD